MTLRLTTMCALLAVSVSAQLPPPPEVEPRHAAYDQLLDINVRDGLVYYRAVQGSRAGLNRYVASLGLPAAEFAKLSRDAQVALLINAYNAIVLQGVVQNYPIQ